MFDRIRRLRRGALAGVGVAAAVVFAASCGGDNNASSNNNGQNALRPAGPAAHKILNLFTPFFWIAVVIGVGVIGMTIYVALRFREKPGEERSPVQVHGNTVLEVSWTIVPFLILMVMAVPTVATIFNLAKVPTGKDVVHVEVAGRQWFWQYTYTDADTGFYTANELHIPINRPVLLELTSNNVIHSFWVPELAGKRDVVPGHPNQLTIEASRPGTFLGQCAEYCGLSHANMRLRVIAQSESDWEAWVKSQQAPLSKDKVDQFDKTISGQWGCTSCHSVTNRTDEKSPDAVGSTIGPNLTHLGDRQAFAGDIFSMNLDNLTKWVYDAPGHKPAGPLQGWMPNFSSKGMTMEQAGQIAKYLLCDTSTDPSSHPECQ
jgi:cytochrome c oxidase subunit 2